MNRYALAVLIALASPTFAEPSKPPAPDRAKPPAVLAEITDVAPAAKGSTITIGAGSNVGVAKGWKGVAIDGVGKPITGSDFTVARVTKVAALAKVNLAPDALQGVKVRLEAP